MSTLAHWQVERKALVREADYTDIWKGPASGDGRTALLQKVMPVCHTSACHASALKHCWRGGHGFAPSALMLLKCGDVAV
jgi:hypothetical protein